MDKVALSASARSTEHSVKNLRKQGQVPAVVYGNNVENTQIQCEEVALMKAFVKAGESTLVELDIGGKKMPVLFHAVDFEPVSDRMNHVDFYAVDMKKEVEAEIPFAFEGDSPAVKEGAVLVKAMDAVTVRCLPANLPHNIPVELSKLVEMGSSLTLRDISIPEGVEIMTDMDAVIVVAQEPRVEEVEQAPVAAEGEAVAGAEGAEGAAAPEVKRVIPGNPEN